MLVFVSYCSRDFPVVKSLILQLGVLGHNVQYEPKMPAGQIRWNHVLESIRACDVFLLGVTSHALQSESRALELQYARRLNKPVLAVLLEEIAAPLPIEFGEPMNYVSQTKQASEDLDRAIKAQVRAPQPTPTQIEAAEPDWRIAVMKLQTAIRSPQINPTEQQWVILNLQEFLERQETFRAAKILLKPFAARRDTDAKIQAEIEETSKQLKQSYVTQRRARMRNIALALMFVLGVMVVAGFLLYRRQQGEQRALEATQTEQAVQVTQTGFVLNNDMTGTANSISSTESARQTETARPTATITPSPTLTPTLNPRFLYDSIFTGIVVENTLAPTVEASPSLTGTRAADTTPTRPTATSTLAETQPEPSATRPVNTATQVPAPTRTLMPPVTPSIIVILTATP